MPDTIESALDEKSISDAACLQSEFSVHVGDLPNEVRIRIWKLIKGTGFYFTQSHYIHTPTQGGPYRSGATHGDQEAEALHLAVQTLVRFYDEAVAGGHAPRESWLVKNESF